MNVRLTTTRRGSRSYTYVQLVQSYRRPDGMPTQRVLASLGKLSDLEIANLRAALDASREGRAVVLPATILAPQRPLSVRANLEWLPLVLLRRLWQDLGLDDLLPGRQSASLSDARVIEALVLHRAVSPGSKLSAVQWFPTTALPELFGVPPARFNNSRVHRALDALDLFEAPLQAALAPRLRSRVGAFIALFLDTSDTWFEGRGPAIARHGRDKEGIFRRRVGIVLLCDQHGYPLRWQTLSGDYRDATAMTALCRELEAVEWLREVPLVMDRAMGRAGTVTFLADCGLRFLTALPVDEYESSGAQVPWQPFASMDLQLTTAAERDDLRRLAETAREAGLEQVEDDRFLLDLGVFAKKAVLTDSSYLPSRAVLALQQAQRIAAAPEESAQQLARSLHLSVRTVQEYRPLTRLVPEVQRRIAEGEADAFTLAILQGIAASAPDEQIAQFEAAKAASASKPRLLPDRKNRSSDKPVRRVRGVVYFSPLRCLEARRTAARQVAELEQLIARLNGELARPTCRRLDNTVITEVTDVLGRLSWRDVYTVTLSRLPDGARALTLTRDEDAWARRRRFDGFYVLVGSPDLAQSAHELLNLYFAKDKVEKAFQTIKSEIELRPVHHRTDGKVRAHVTLCVLALLLERHLEHLLRTAERPRTAPATLDLLSTCRLNLIAQEEATYYTVTDPTPDQRDLLEVLGALDLADDKVISQLLTPR